ncbi:MAG: PAS domain-containing sensor histidine kinase [Flavobacterium sp.]|nr:MAG: PAS domain-containing sensor histidine kinase [Flavobacterium sp.]
MLSHSIDIADSLVFTDVNACIISANASFYNFTGATAESAEGKHLFDIGFSGWRNSGLRELVEKVLPRYGSFHDFQFDAEIPNLGRRRLSVSAHRVPGNKSGEWVTVMRISGLTADKKIDSKQRKATEHVVDSPDFLASILNSTRSGISNYSPVRDARGSITDFVITFTNAMLPASFGYNPEEVTGKNISEIYPQFFENGTFEKLSGCVSSGFPDLYESEIEFIGSSTWLRTSLVRFNDSVTATTEDITAEKKAKDHQENINKLLAGKNKELEKRIISEFSESFSSYKSGGSFFASLLSDLYARMRMEYMWLGEIVQNDDGKDMIRCLSVIKSGQPGETLTYEVLDNPTANVVKGKFYAVVENLQQEYPEIAFFREEGINGYAGYPLFDSKSNCIGVICILNKNSLYDLSYIQSMLKIAAKRGELELERMRNEKMLEEKNAELERNVKELESFNYIASHDLQEPLRKIQLFYSRIVELDKNSLSPTSLQYFKNIENAAQRMQKLIEALLSYSTASAVKLEYKKTDLNTILDEVRDDLADMIDSRGAVIEAGALPKISVIPYQFRQLLENIVSNGIKFTEKEKTPHIRITAEETSPDEGKGASFWKIDVTDEGIGFEQQYEQRIFQLFQRLHGKAEYAGTGIGLAICRKIIDNHKGFIKVKSEPGHGSTFSIFVPVHLKS